MIYVPPFVTTASAVGELGVVMGVTDTDASDSAEDPIAFTAITLKV